jgi:hypothetical protein
MGLIAHLPGNALQKDMAPVMRRLITRGQALLEPSLHPSHDRKTSPPGKFQFSPFPVPIPQNFTGAKARVIVLGRYGQAIIILDRPSRFNVASGPRTSASQPPWDFLANLVGVENSPGTNTANAH